MADWARCPQCGRRYWAGDSYRPVPPPPRLPGENAVHYGWRKSVFFVRSVPNLRLGDYWIIAACEECSAKNDEGWKAHELFMKQKARLESVEKMLAGLRQPLRAEEQLQPGWDARRAELIKELEAERAALLEDL